MHLILRLDRTIEDLALVNGLPYRLLERRPRTVTAHINANAGNYGRTPGPHLCALAYRNAIPAALMEGVLEQTGLASVAPRASEVSRWTSSRPR